MTGTMIGNPIVSTYKLEIITLGVVKMLLLDDKTLTIKGIIGTY